MNIQDWRSRIDEVDQQLVKLLSLRAQMAIEIGRTKSGAGVEVYDADRERDVLLQVESANPGVLTREALEHLFREIVRESRQAAERAVISAASQNEASADSTLSLPGAQ